MNQKEREAREFYERKLKRKIPDLVWHQANDERGLVGHYAGKDAYRASEDDHADEDPQRGSADDQPDKDPFHEWKDEVEDNAETIRRFLHVYDASPAVSDTGSLAARFSKPVFRLGLDYTTNDRRRLYALTRLFAEAAGSRSDVKSFRETLLGEAEITSDEVFAGLNWLKGREKEALARPEDYDVEAVRGEMRKLWARKPSTVPPLLSDGDARQLVRSPLAQCLSFKQFRRFGISPARHKIATSSMSTVSGRHPERMVCLKDPDRVIWLYEYDGVSIRLVTVALGDSEVRDRRIPGATTAAPELLYPLPRGGEGKVEVWPGSVLGELSALALVLARSFYWTEAGAAWFVLTGEMPVVHGLDIRVFHKTADDMLDSHIEIRMLPWIDPSTIQAALKGIRSELAHDGRPLGDRGYELVGFVMSQTGADIAPKDPAWKQLCRKWNDDHATKDRFRNAADMRAAFCRARDSLLRQKYR